MAKVTHIPKQVLVTGGAGFIGSNFIRHLLMSDQNVEVVNLDALTYAGNLANLDDLLPVVSNRYRFIQADITDELAVETIFGEGKFDTVIHLAAESHVDRLWTAHWNLLKRTSWEQQCYYMLRGVLGVTVTMSDSIM